MKLGNKNLMKLGNKNLKILNKIYLIKNIKCN